MLSRRATIIDVAKHAQVSITAVSKVLRNADGVSPAMQAKVRQAIMELGYRPRTAARGMRGQTYTIGVMLPSIRNPFFPEIIDGLTERLRDSEYEVLVGPSTSSRDEQARIIEAMIDRGMDGLVLVAPTSQQRYLERIASLVPTVVVGRHGHSGSYDTVVDDDLAGASLIVGHLADLGHTRIAHIEHLETDPSRIETMPNAVRAQGYRLAMRARDLADETTVVSTTYTAEGGYIGMKELLALPRRPTAIFAGADIVAMGVLDALAGAGLSVPDDISVAGYDNTTFAALGPISLTSIDQAGRQMGDHAAALLLARVADRRRPSVFISLTPTLVVRATTGPPPVRRRRTTVA